MKNKSVFSFLIAVLLYLLSAPSLIASTVAPEGEKNLYLLGMAGGVLIIMVIYNLFLFASIREKSYLYYSVYVSGLISYIMLMDGVGIQYFWQDSAWMLEKQMPISIGIFQCFYNLFLRAFLQTPKYTPRLDKAFIFLIFLAFGATVLAVAYDFEIGGNILAANGVFPLPLILAAGILCWRQGFTPAKFFLIAGASFFAGGVVLGLQILGIIPGSVETGFQYMKMGILIEAVLYSFALADRLKYERKLKEDAQLLALENLRKADKIKDEFLANTSHELRTPLNGIIGLAEATLHSPDLKSESAQKIRSNLEMVISSGRRLSLLVNDILDFSKLKHKEIPLNRRAISIHRMVESVLALNQTAIRKKPVRLINRVDRDTTPAVFADEARLEQILYNLIGNAIKFTAEGAVTITARQVDDQLVISVADTGIGIPKEKQDQIFNAFEQVDGTDTRQYEGTGLGLTIVKQLVELHQSQLTVESEPNRGSVFSFALPIVKEELLDETESPSAVSPSALPVYTESSDSVSTLKGFLDILVVDDDPLNIEVICQQLSAEHYSLRVANNGSEALHLVEERKPDLILLDVMMPVLSGFEVCEFLRNQFHQNHLPIIFLTAKNREEDVIRGLEIGGNDYLTKPFFRTELLQRVETQLEISIHQKQSDALRNFANKISHYVSQQEMIQEAFEQIAHWSLVDEAAIFQSDQLLFYKKQTKEQDKTIFEAPTKALLKRVEPEFPASQIIITNDTDQNHPVSQFYQSGHFVFITPQQLPDHLLVLYRNPERKPFDESKATAYARSMINQVQTTGNNLESLFEDDKLVSVIGLVQPRLSEITHVKSASPTLELYFDSDRRPEYITGCSLEKLSLYFNETLLMRTHKSYLVNKSKVVSLHRASKSRLLKMELTSGEIIPVGRTYMEKVRQVFAELLS